MIGCFKGKTKRFDWTKKKMLLILYLNLTQQSKRYFNWNKILCRKNPTFAGQKGTYPKLFFFYQRQENILI